ncbi:MAG: cation transporter, partial [Candidatus Limnocylindrus sp.]
MAAQHPHQHHDHPHDHGDHPHDHAGHHDHHTGWRGVLSKFFGHSHDHADSIDDALTRSARGIRAVKISLVGLGITALLQLVIVAITSSVALLADTIHNFSDAMTSIPLWIAFLIGRRAATRRYTSGY